MAVAGCPKWTDVVVKPGGLHFFVTIDLKTTDRSMARIPLVKRLKLPHSHLNWSSPHGRYSMGL